LIIDKVTDENKLAHFLWPTVKIQIHSESEFGFNGKSNGLESGFVGVVHGVVGSDVIVVRLRNTHVIICCSLPVSLVNPRQNWIRWIHESGLGSRTEWTFPSLI